MKHGFATAVAIANRQGARGYALLASLSLAGAITNQRAAGTTRQAILAPALEGFFANAGNV